MGKRESVLQKLWAKDIEAINEDVKRRQAAGFDSDYPTFDVGGVTYGVIKGEGLTLWTLCGEEVGRLHNLIDAKLIYVLLDENKRPTMPVPEELEKQWRDKRSAQVCKETGHGPYAGLKDLS